MSKRIVVIGGSAAGPKAAAKARRMDENAHITIIQKGRDLSMTSCGYPYYVDGITTIQSMEDADFLRKIRDDKSAKRALVVGGGLIGIETCEALELAGIEITPVEKMPQLLPFLDWEVAKAVKKHAAAKKVRVMLDAKDPMFLPDARGPDEFEMMRLGIGETLIPLGALRKRLSELPEDKNAEIVCYCKISLRGYEAALILEGHGYSNVKVLEGGILAWPYAREK